MIVFSVNCGHFRSFKEAFDFRKRKMSSQGAIFAYDDGYTVKVLTTFRQKEAEAVRNRLSHLDSWIGEKDTSTVGGK